MLTWVMHNKVSPGDKAATRRPCCNADSTVTQRGATHWTSLDAGLHPAASLGEMQQMHMLPFPCTHFQFTQRPMSVHIYTHTHYTSTFKYNILPELTFFKYLKDVVSWKPIASSCPNQLQSESTHCFGVGVASSWWCCCPHPRGMRGSANPQLPTLSHGQGCSHRAMGTEWAAAASAQCDAMAGFFSWKE